MLFSINESVTPEQCIEQAEYNRIQRDKLDAKAAELKAVLQKIPSWETPSSEDWELVTALSNRIESILDCADNYDRYVDYWNVQLMYAKEREKNK